MSAGPPFSLLLSQSMALFCTSSIVACFPHPLAIERGGIFFALPCSSDHSPSLLKQSSFGPEDSSAVGKLLSHVPGKFNAQNPSKKLDAVVCIHDPSIPTGRHEAESGESAGSSCMS